MECSKDFSRQVQQIATYCSKESMVRYERFFYQNSWGNWMCTQRKVWPESTATRSSYMTGGNILVSYNPSLELATVCGDCIITPSAAVTAGTLIQVATFTGPAVPYKRIALSIYSHSSSTLRWTGYIGSDGSINVRANGALTASTGYELVINAVWYCADMAWYGVT